MKALLHSGLVLVLGVFVARSVAEELQWRPAGAASASPSTDSQRGLPLGRPMPLDAPPPEVTPVTFRPASTVVRAKTDTPRPLPSGPALNQEPIRIIDDPPKSDAKKDRELIPFPPRIIDDGLEPEIVTSDSAPLCCPSWRCRERVICRDCCWDDCGWDGCGAGYLPRPRFWLMAEYLLWNIADQQIPPLVTTSPPGTGIVDAGVLGAPGTTVLFDEGAMSNAERSGARFTLGFWLPCYSDVGLETSFFFLGRRNNNFSAGSTGTPILARPIFDVVQGREVSQLVAFPGVVSGSVNVDYDTRLWGLDFGFRHKLCCDCRSWIDLTYGYRHLYLEDNIDILENLSAVQAAGAPLGIVVRDSFQTRNIFNGGYLGLEAERKLLRRWFIGGYAKVAMGVNHQVININGSTTFSTVAAGVGNPQPAGILALPTNIGHHTRDRFAVMPEFGLKVGYSFNDHFRIWVGWNGLWFTDTVRAGEQIDRGINRTQIPSNVAGIGRLVGEPRPRVLFNEQTFWANGLTAGLEYRY